MNYVIFKNMDLINRIREKLESGEMKLYGVNAWTQERVRLKPYRDGFVVCDAFGDWDKDWDGCWKTLGLDDLDKLELVMG